VWVRSALTGLNSPALASFVSGEEKIVAEYERAMEHAKGGAPEVEELLTRQEQALLGQIMKMRTLATAMKSIGR
jgi:hypothetical protein